MLRLICQTTMTTTTTLWTFLLLLVLPLLLTATPTTSSAAALQQQQQPYDCPKECICLSSTQVRYYLLLYSSIFQTPWRLSDYDLTQSVCVCVCSLCILLSAAPTSWLIVHDGTIGRREGEREIRADFFWLSPLTPRLSIFCFIFFPFLRPLHTD